MANDIDDMHAVDLFPKRIVADGINAIAVLKENSFLLLVKNLNYQCLLLINLTLQYFVLYSMSQQDN